MNQLALLRYNFRVMMLNNWMLLAFPIAVSQLTVFWFVLTQKFSPQLPAQSVEMITPLLAAFLGAHLLSAEYRSRVGAVLASRPVNIGRIVVLRLIVMLALVWTLAGLSLLAYTVWMQPFDLFSPILACIPSTLFLTLLALTFATLFRHSLAGFGIAALYWAMDMVPGAPLQPYLSLRSLSSYYAVLDIPYHRTFLETWWISKGILLAAALLLYMVHARLVFTLGSAYTQRTRRRAALGAAAIVGVYLVSGAMVRVIYGYNHRGSLPNSDLAWFRYQFASYGPIPITPLFGPGFTRYLGEIINPWRSEAEESDLLGDTEKHHHDLKDVLDKMPDSMWAPSAADAYSRMLAHRSKQVEEVAAYYRYTAAHYPESPYLDYSLRMIARTYADAERPAEEQTAYLELLKRVPNTIYRAEALRFLVENELKDGHLPEAGRWAEQWVTVAPVHEKFEAYMYLAQTRKAAGDIAGAKQALQSMQTAIRDYRKALQARSMNLTPSQVNLRNQAVQRAEEVARKLL